MSIASAPAPFPGVLTSLDEWRAVVSPPGELACRTVIDALDRHCPAYIAYSPFWNTLY